MLWREWRAGELRVLVAALLVAVGGISAVGFFVDRIEQAMVERASELLAADFLVTSRDDIPPEWEAQARQAGLRTARTLTFRSVVVADENMRLTQVKAVTEGYPLRGQLRESDSPFGADRPSTSIPEPGNVWLEGRVLAALGLAIGETIEIGASTLRIDRVLTYEPDRGGDLFSVAPRVLMNLADVPATQLVQPGSRVRHRLLFAAPREMGDDYRASLAEGLPVNYQIHTVREGRPQLRGALDRARQFLGLAALVGVMLAGVAIAISAARHAERSLDSTALLRCFGATQGTVIRIFAIRLLCLALVGGLAGSLLGYLAQFGLAALVGSLLVGNLPPPGIGPLFAGLGVALVTLGGFGLPPLLRLRHVPPGRVLRRDLGDMPAPAWAAYFCGAAALALLAWWQAGHLKLAAMVLGGIAATLIALAVVAYLVVKGLGAFRPRVGTATRFAIAAISRGAGGSVIQVVSFGLGLMALLLLAVVRGELLDQWRTSLPDDAPNFFLVNVQPHEVKPLTDYMAGHDMQVAQLFPMIRGRLTHRNGKPVSPDDYDDPRAARLAAREFNLSFAEQRPSHNELLSGTWWNTAGASGDPGQVSMEQGIGETLGIRLGDSVRFHIAGADVDSVVTSVRKVRWDSFKVNFFFIGSPASLSDHPATYATSFHLDAARSDELVELVRQFPSVTVFDIDALMRQVRGIMEHASLGVEYVFGFTLLAGLMVLLATIQSTLDERRRDAAVLRTLGASRKLLVQSLLIEFALLGAIAGGLAAAGANATAIVLASEVFRFTLGWQPSLWLLGIAIGAGGVALAGYIGTRRVLLEPPLTTLQRV
ncbi:MAG: ABC transporter permease [Chromatiales bacterium]|nr:ABC transporter permease [Chromatiales bacterium]